MDEHLQVVDHRLNDLLHAALHSLAVPWYCSWRLRNRVRVVVVRMGLELLVGRVVVALLERTVVAAAPERIVIALLERNPVLESNAAAISE